METAVDLSYLITSVGAEKNVLTDVYVLSLHLYRCLKSAAQIHVVPGASFLLIVPAVDFIFTSGYWNSLFCLDFK